MDYYPAINKSEILPFATTWVEVEGMMLRKSYRERQILYDISYMWNLKYDTDELIYETETDSWTQKTDLWLPRGRREREGRIWSLGLADSDY